MAHPFHHAQSSAKRFGGVPQDYQHIHDWFDETKANMADFRHRALRHHSLGIFWCEEEFGTVITISTGKKVPVRMVAEQHVREDFSGFIPSVQDWLKGIPFETWMQPTAEHQRTLMQSITI